MEALFTQALGLSPPWAVVSVDFRQPEGAIHFAVECQAKRLACPACGAADQPIHDRIKRRWQHLHFFQFRAFIHATNENLIAIAYLLCARLKHLPRNPWLAPATA